MQRQPPSAEAIELVNGQRLPDQPITEEAFVAWCDEDTRAEWVDGKIIMMSPASRDHIDLNGWLCSLLRIFVEQRDLGVVCGPEFQVRLGAQRRRRVPDLLFVAKDRTGIVQAGHVEGAPDLVVEIVSPDSVSRDWREKYLEYEAAGVREYWVLDPLAERVEAYSLSEANGYVRIEETKGVVASVVVPGFYLRSAWLWGEQLPKVLDTLRELGING